MTWIGGHLEDEGLIRTSSLNSDNRAVVLTARGRDLLEANRYQRTQAQAGDEVVVVFHGRPQVAAWAIHKEESG